MTDGERPALRRRLRAARRAVGAAERPGAAIAVDAALHRLGLPRPHTRIAAYRPMDGEIDPAIVLRRAKALGCEILYPVITNLRGRRMRFAIDGIGTEGAIPDLHSGHWLDLVLVPLVGFDTRGNRLGMGGGFYDRHFAFLRNRQAWRRPLLIGLAFDVQRVPRLSDAAHDVPLWGIVTERGIYGRAAAHARGPSRGRGG
ncbi:MAG TPA: 5-formyltetrahydrofolate cyclo-ligase [Steroidobacteraceae bacterium]